MINKSDFSTLNKRNKKTIVLTQIIVIITNKNLIVVLYLCHTAKIQLFFYI